MTCLLVRDSDPFLQLRFYDRHTVWYGRELGMNKTAQKSSCRQAGETVRDHNDGDARGKKEMYLSAVGLQTGGSYGFL
jgi:hypothetical protein